MRRAQALVGQLHANDQRWVLILDPCIHASQNYTPYATGIAQDVFVKDITGRPFLGQARAGCSVSFASTEVLIFSIPSSGSIPRQHVVKRAWPGDSLR